MKISNGQKIMLCLINGGCHCMWSSYRMSCNIQERRPHIGLIPLLCFSYRYVKKLLKGYHKWSVHCKYEMLISYGSNVIVKVKVDPPILRASKKWEKMWQNLRGRPFDSEGGGAGTFGRDRLFIFITGSAGKFIFGYIEDRIFIFNRNRKKGGGG